MFSETIQKIGPASVHSNFGEVTVKETPKGFNMCVVDQVIFVMYTVISHRFPMNDFVPEALANVKNWRFLR